MSTATARGGRAGEKVARPNEEFSRETDARMGGWERPEVPGLREDQPDESVRRHTPPPSAPSRTLTSTIVWIEPRHRPPPPNKLTASHPTRLAYSRAPCYPRPTPQTTLGTLPVSCNSCNTRRRHCAADLSRPLPPYPRPCPLLPYPRPAPTRNSAGISAGGEGVGEGECGAG